MPAPQYGSIPAEALLSLNSMEGVYELPVVEAKPAAPQPKSRPPYAGYAMAGGITLAAYLIHYLPFAPFLVGNRRPISAAILAIAAGVVVRNLAPVPAAVIGACKGIVRRIVPITIVLTGAGLNLASLAGVGVAAGLIVVSCIALAAASAWYFGRMLGIGSKASMLIGAGTAICGTSAIVAVAPLIDADDDDLTLSVGTINVLGLLLMFLLPAAGGLLQLSDTAFGVWAGTAIHAVPQVVTAAFAYSDKSGTLGTLIKLFRVAMLAPFTFGLAILYTRRRSTKQLTIRYSRLVPGFLWGFLALAFLNTIRAFPVLGFHLAGFLPGAVRDFQISSSDLLVDAGELLLALAMAAMGLEVNVPYMIRVGGRAMLTGAAASLCLCGGSLLLIRLLVT